MQDSMKQFFELHNKRAYSVFEKCQKVRKILINNSFKHTVTETLEKDIGLLQVVVY